MQRNKTNIIKFHKQIQINIGLIIFIIVFIYVLFHVFSYVTAENITVYEVTEGTLVKNDLYRALAIRSEEIVTAETSGDVFYYAKNLDAVGVKSVIYSVDTNGSINALLKDTGSDSGEESTALSEAHLSEAAADISDFVYEYDGDQFAKVLTFKSDLSSTLSQYYSSQVLEEHATQIAQAQAAGTFAMFLAKTAGIVVYQTDGFEKLTLDQVTSESFDTSNLTVNNLSAQEHVDAGDAVYKIITSDNWNLIMPIDASLAESLTNDDTTYLEIRFTEDNATTWAACSVSEKAGMYYLTLSLDDSVARYADSRFVTIELLLNEESGLKIPNSAIIEKEFFAVPKSYFFMGNDSDSSGLMRKSGASSEFVTPTIYYETDDAYYIDSEDLAAEDTILKPDSQETYVVGSQTATLQGVYNVNKGYAVFKQIDILFRNEDYAIVATGTSYGLSLYDHIVLQGDLVEENEIIH